MTDEQLDEIARLLDSTQPGPWRAMVEGRDHTSGDDFIMIGDGSKRKQDMYISLGRNPAPAEDLDFIASARNNIPLLLREIRRLRESGHR